MDTLNCGNVGFPPFQGLKGRPILSRAALPEESACPIVLTVCEKIENALFELSLASLLDSWLDFMVDFFLTFLFLRPSWITLPAESRVGFVPY